MWCSCGWNCERRRERMMSEATDQMALIEFAARFAERVPELARLVHVPNGEHRAKGTAGRLKAMGVRAGYPDLLLDVPRGGYHGLRIELKAGKGRTSDAQTEWIAFLRAAGYAVHVCYGWPAAAIVILEYLGADPKEFGL